MIKKYTKKNGKTAYMVSIYLGKDPITGKERRTTRRGFNSKRDAKLVEAKLQTQANENGPMRNDISTFEELYKLWLDQYKPTVKESTYLNVQTIFRNNILPKFDNKKLKGITLPYCQSVLNNWSKTKVAYDIFKAYTSNVLDYGIKLQVISKNPMKLTSLPKKKIKQGEDESLYYSKDELQKFLYLVEDDLMLYTIFRLLAFTGIRKGELYALTWEDIDFENMTLNINKTTYKPQNRPISTTEPKTSTSNRSISIDTQTIQSLKKWRKLQREIWFKLGFNTSSKDQLLFSNESKNHYLYPEFINNKMKKVCMYHNFKLIKVHGFRHTHCSLLFESGATIQEVRERLGHSEIETTMKVYAHVTQNQRDQLADKFSKYINF